MEMANHSPSIPVETTKTALAARLGTRHSRPGPTLLQGSPALLEAVLQGSLPLNSLQGDNFPRLIY